jgi:hypothetical protein
MWARIMSLFALLIQVALPQTAEGHYLMSNRDDSIAIANLV